MSIHYGMYDNIRHRNCLLEQLGRLTPQLGIKAISVLKICETYTLK